MSFFCVEKKKKGRGHKLYLKLLSGKQRAKTYFHTMSVCRLRCPPSSLDPVFPGQPEACRFHAFGLESRNTFHLLNMCDHMHYCSHHRISLCTVSFDETICVQRNIIIHVLAFFFIAHKKLFTVSRNAGIVWLFYRQLYCITLYEHVLFFFFELFIFPSVLQQLSACLMDQSFRWGVTGMALCFWSEALAVIRKLCQV